jgi:hypothetical protein
MRRLVLAGAVAIAVGVSASLAGAVVPEDFKILKTQNLYNLCSAPADSELHAEALQACYGFIYGAGLFYYEVVKAGAAKSVVCAKGELTRDSVREAFVTWAVKHPERMTESPVDGLLRSAAARWPCAGDAGTDLKGKKG